MSTYTEQDCLNKIAQMKTWREDAGDALEEKRAIEDASATLLEDMPPLIALAGQDGTYCYVYRTDTQDFSYDYGLVTSPSTSNTITLAVKSNTSWEINGTQMGSDAAGQIFTGTGDSSVTLTCSSVWPYLCRFYRILVGINNNAIRHCFWLQRYSIN